MKVDHQWTLVGLLGMLRFLVETGTRSVEFKYYQYKYRYVLLRRS